MSQPHSQTCNAHTYTLTISQYFKISEIRARQRIRNVERPHSPVPQTAYWSQTESSKRSLNRLRFQPRHLRMAAPPQTTLTYPPARALQLSARALKLEFYLIISLYFYACFYACFRVFPYTHYHYLSPPRPPPDAIIAMG